MEPTFRSLSVYIVSMYTYIKFIHVLCMNHSHVKTQIHCLPMKVELKDVRLYTLHILLGKEQYGRIYNTQQTVKCSRGF